MGRAAGTDVAAAVEAAADRKFERPRWHLKRARPMNELSTDARPLTSVELLDAAVWRGKGSEGPQPRATFCGGVAGVVWRGGVLGSGAAGLRICVGEVGRRGRHACGEGEAN